MNFKEGYDVIDGQKVPHTFIKDNHELEGTHQGTVVVESGKFALVGKLQGSLSLDNSETEIIGEQQGSVSISSIARVSVSGAIQGSVFISPGATVVIEPTGKISGSLTNHGTLVVRGVFGGAQSGNGEIILEGSGFIKQPTVKNGINYYEW